MFNFRFARTAVVLLAALPFDCTGPLCHAQHKLAPSGYNPRVLPASNEGELAIKRFTVPPGFKVDLFAAEPDAANIVGFNFDEKGRCYVSETFRLGKGVIDIRGIKDWLDEDLACRSVDDRLKMMKRHLGEKIAEYMTDSERVRLLEDRDGDGKVDRSTVFADRFNTILDGLGASVLVRKGDVYFSNIPNLWRLRDLDGDGVAEDRKSLHYGFGVRIGFIGHDLHGLRFGPDGKLYFSIGDRGSNVRVADGRNVGEPDSGCVFRCNPDGSELEVFAYGLRNPQGLAFDDHGNLFTGDNNSDSGDRARWVYVVEGGDSGWRIGYQFLEGSYSRGPFNAEKLWYPQFDGQAAYIVPPITNITDGPSGLSYYPGTGLPDSYAGHFFLVDFRGGGPNSGVHTFTLKPNGASFTVEGFRHFVWQMLATDCQFGVDGGLYVSDWVQGWGMTGKGRIYRVHDPAVDQSASVLETKKLLADGMDKRSNRELARLLSHPDNRIRQEAQYALADKGASSVSTLVSAARKNRNSLARLHAIWGIGQVSSKFKGQSANPEVLAALETLVQLLGDEDAEVRAQSAKVLGDVRFARAYDGLTSLLGDSSPRVRFFAAMSLGKLGRREAVPAIFALLRANAEKDPYLRHAGVMALAYLNDVDALVAAASDSSRSVRIGALLALRRLERPEIAVFLKDPDPEVLAETARAINDVPISGAMPELAALIGPDDSTAALIAKTSADSKFMLLRRVLNANFRYGTAQTAKALAAFASAANAPETMRVEALAELGDWPTASGRDRVTGMWRPTAFVRNTTIPGDAAKPVLAGILKTAPEPVRVAAARTAGLLGVADVAPVLLGLASDTQLGSTVRIEALKALFALNDVRINDAVKAAVADADESVRREATRLQARLKPSDAIGPLIGVLTGGTTSEKQSAFATLGGVQDPAADKLLLEWLDKLIAGQVAAEVQLDVIEAADKRSSEAVKSKLAAYQASKPKDDPLAAFRETLQGGNAAEGRKVFYERAEVQCVRCHKINSEGGEVGPDLSKIGAQKDRTYLIESVLVPNKDIAAGFESVVVSLKNGTVYAGVLKSENAGELVINSPEDGVVTVKKADIQARDKGLSPMPEGMDQILSKQDFRNLVEYLGGLK
jgi:quinoprotein glucose dehydrogenase